jgi:hypothetical protein
MAVLAILAFLVAGLPATSALSQEAPEPLARCINVTFLIYSYIGTPTPTGCWRYERPVQANWKRCHWLGHPQNPGAGSGPNWLYDDTNPEHNPAGTESAEITACAKGNNGLGYVMMARRHDQWRRTQPAGVTVTRFYAETYSGESQTNDFLSKWEANPSIGRPMLNIGPAATEAAVESAISAVCTRIAADTYMGVYSSREIHDNKLHWINVALNRCVA